MSTYYYTKSAIDLSLNDNFYNKTTIDLSINNILLNYSQGIQYQVSNIGAGAYLINNISNSALTLIRGLTYVFSINASGHPFWIQTTEGSYSSGNIYNTGITNNGTQTQNIRWVIPNDAPNTLYYVCEYHSSMQGVINIIDFSFATLTDVNNSLTANFYNKSAIDLSLNDNFYNKTTSDSTFLAKTAFDSSMSTYYYSKSAIDLSLNDNFYNKTTSDSTFLAKTAFDSSMSSYYYTKSIIDSSLNDNFYNKTTSDSTFLAKTAFDTSMSTYYSTKSAIDASLTLYSTISYVDGRFTTLTGVAPSQLDTLAEIATALQGDASFGVNVYQRINSSDSSINTIWSSLSSYATTTSLSTYSTAADSSINTIRSSLSSYTLKSTVDASLSSYATTASLSSYASLVSDISFAGSVQFGTSNRSYVGINKAPSTQFSLDVSGSTNITGNLALTTSPSIPLGSFDLSSVNMSVFNVSEKFTTVALSATPTLDYSTGGIFYMAAVNAALTTVSITNVPTTLNRSISITLILAQTGGAGTFCFTTGTLNVNGVGITYLKPDATALAAPSGARAIIINQFTIIWVSGTPTVIAYLSSM
jgi:hypothetical protein